MSCCGQMRQGLKSTGRTGRSVRDARVAPDGTPRPTPPPQSGPVEFEYVGDRTLVVMGQSTRQIYRFDGRGARLRVDPRDRVSLSMTPGLRETPR